MHLDSFKILSKKPLTDKVLQNRLSFVKWMTDIHNEVNSRLGKKKISLDYNVNELKYQTIDYSKMLRKCFIKSCFNS